MNLARLFFAASVALGCYFVYTAGTGALRSHRMSQEQQAAADEVRALEDTKLYLEAVVRYVASDAYVEQEARRRLGYARDTEVPVVVDGPALPAQPSGGASWWERLFPR